MAEGGGHGFASNASGGVVVFGEEDGSASNPSGGVVVVVVLGDSSAGNPRGGVVMVGGEMAQHCQTHKLFYCSSTCWCAVRDCRSVDAQSESSSPSSVVIS